MPSIPCRVRRQIDCCRLLKRALELKGSFVDDTELTIMMTRMQMIPTTNAYQM